ncbi:MAG: phosphatase PAP2 family protein [Acholeplasmatales bacterium]|nr:phosphatase PAP2 family protein [Acholeplasmatales bacterium]
MKKIRILLYSLLCLTILGIIVGSFCDLNISKAIADKNNTFALLISVLIPTIAFSGLAIVGGAFFAFAIRGDYKKSLKVFFYIVAIGIVIISEYFSGREYFGKNGFYNKAPQIVGYLIPIIPILLMTYLGFYLFKNNENKNAWIILLIALFAILIPYVFLIEGIKLFVHRPRFRIVNEGFVPFKAWWENFKDYKEAISLYNVTKEDFKSFPSGHTAEATMLLIFSIFIPMANTYLKKYQTPAIIFSICMILIMALGRILAAAHYLSDVSAGAFTLILFAIIAYEIIIHNKKLNETL